MTNIDKEREAFEQELFNHVQQEHGVSLLHTEIQDVYEICAKYIAKQHSGEAVAYCSEESLNTAKDGRDAIFGAKTKDCRTVALYTTPQQPQEVAEALEKMAKKISNMDINPSPHEMWVLIKDIQEDIRNLINQPTQKESS